MEENNIMSSISSCILLIEKEINVDFDKTLWTYVSVQYITIIAHQTNWENIIQNLFLF